MSGISMIAQERTRQITDKGYDAAHDDAHSDGFLVDVAASLLRLGPEIASQIEVHDGTPEEERTTVHILRKHGHDRIRVLAIAGALIAAEIDRLEREKVRSTK